MELLTRLEDAILVAVLRLGDTAYGVAVNREVNFIFDRNYTLGALYFALGRLVNKEYLAKRLEEGTAKRGGRSRTYYRLTPEGKEALEAARLHGERLRRAVPRPGKAG
ncbi:MAG: helix-turn-helix transcriptional regulator [Candidatus Aminicenantes bacterium]|nr:helix-turn-helix transcriptional regulator [Candidatus Aminicenantes bacterium]